MVTSEDRGNHPAYNGTASWDRLPTEDSPSCDKVAVPDVSAKEGDLSVNLEPEKVEISEQGIRIDWKDGHHSVYAPRMLRLHCPCAHCIDEWTRAPRLDPETVPQDVYAADYMMVGNYAVEFLWSDAHYTGIYTYESLRSLCSCMECLPSKE